MSTAMPQPDPHSPWVNATLAALSLDQKIGQLLHGCVSPGATPAEIDGVLAGVQPGGMFLFSGTFAQFGAATAHLQSRSPVPMVISSDLENGAGRIIQDATIFPDLMALAATDDLELAAAMARAAAREGRAAGVHWTFGPVVDINANPHNPITNTRSLGDRPDTIAAFAKTLIHEMQTHGLCATAKHFPGDGFDDRDQHVCTTVNPLRLDQWHASSGRLFKEAMEAGVWSMMIGHIALPAVDPGAGRHLSDAPPATLSPKIVQGLLRETLGF